MAQGICEGLSMKIILDDLKVKYEGPIKLFCDNSSAISIVHNLVQHDRTKHIEIDKHFIKEQLDNGLIVRAHDPTGLQVADVSTKGLPTTRFQELNGNHIEGNSPPRDDPKFEAWDDEDSLIMTWLWNSMTLEIN
ncbi:Copia protein, partial [Mucuna pruriens]